MSQIDDLPPLRDVIRRHGLTPKKSLIVVRFCPMQIWRRNLLQMDWRQSCVKF